MKLVTSLQFPIIFIAFYEENLLFQEENWTSRVILLVKLF